MKRQLALASVMLLLAGCASQPKLTEQDIFTQFPEVLEAKTQLAQVQEEKLALYSPQLTLQANAAYEKAMQLARKGKAESEVAARESIATIAAAKKKTAEAKYAFDEVLVARERARNVNAQNIIPDDYDIAEKALSNAFASLEAGDEAKAKKDINQMRLQFLDLELKALKTNLTSFAKEALAKAKADDIADSAPRTMLAAQDEYKLALNTLEADRTDIPKANIHASKAIWLTQQATSIAQSIKSFENAKFDEEQKLLWYQKQLSRVVAPLETSVEFNLPNKEMVQDLQNKIAVLVKERNVLSASVEQAKRQNIELEASSKQAVSALQKDKDQAVLAAQLALEQEQSHKREIAQKFAAVQSMFTPDEATVYRQLDNVLIRAQGFAFKSGSSEIESTNFVLLNKIIDAIKRFPNSNIVVSGHTDSIGGDDLNLQLSQRRAQTVANFITQVGQVAPQRVEHLGYGKEKPVATNETDKGRAANRRVEILIVNTTEN
ncbi:MAG: outer membrane protein OmpA-like peptidoglycan-associated protein [Paraglaciecola sp.]|jgi:outer membrane protein OmpA-like peptidoglycan-associated protein